MATKKETKPATAASAANTAVTASGVSLPGKPAKDKEAKIAAENKDLFLHKSDLAKGAPQAKGIVNILKAHADANKENKDYKGMTRVELVEAMKGVIVTRQPESRILSYYQKALTDSGAITMTKGAAPAAAVVAVAPAQETAKTE